MMDIRISEFFKRGRNGEQIVAELVKGKGCFVIPSYDYSGEDGNKAPKMQGAINGYTLPDLDVCRDGSRKWIEVKTKASATWTRTTQQYEHGIDVAHYESYLAVEKQTGCQVWLAIYEENTGDILTASISSLEPFKRISPRMGKRGMIFWPRDKFSLLANIKKEDS